MGELTREKTVDVSDVVRRQDPDKIKGDRVGVAWTGDRKLSIVTFFFDFTRLGTKVAEARLEIMPGTIADAAERAFEQAKTVAAGGGIKEGDAGWPTKEDAQAEWQAIVALIGDGSAIPIADIVDIVTGKAWGQYMLKCAWGAKAVTYS